MQNTSAPHAFRRDDSRAIGLWLVAIAAMVVAMMLIGAITRLTESGLSIVEWAPLMGTLPPLHEGEWQRLFDLYRQTSQYQIANAGMSLDEFKTIFFWEYVHRLWGRLIGLAFAIPFVVFLIRRGIPNGLWLHLAVLFLLGGMQGAIGWWMVVSGFVDRTDVSQYRLATHLGTAFLIFAYLIYVALGLLKPRPAVVPAGAARWRLPCQAMLAVVSITVLAGALVAGLDAGFTYNTWPLMDGDLLYRHWFLQSPWWINGFENVGAVQFNHRMLAYATVLGAVTLWWAVRNAKTAPAGVKSAARAVAVTAVLQMALGIATLLTGVNIVLATLHQGGAACLFGLTVWLVYEARAARPAAVPVDQTVRPMAASTE